MTNDGENASGAGGTLANMWPLYNPSLYQPPSPTKRMSPAEFAAELAEIERKPDVDNVFEAMSMLRGQESIRPLRMTLRRYFFHPFMALPAAVLVVCGLFVVLSSQSDSADVSTLARHFTHVGAATGTTASWPILLLGMAIILFGVRASMRDKDPEVLQMRASAATSIARMANNPEYIHEPFTDDDRGYLRKLLKGRSRDADRALGVLLSDVATAREPDPEFRGNPEERL